MIGYENINVLEQRIKEVYKLHNDLANQTDRRTSSLQERVARLERIAGEEPTVPVKKSGWVNVNQDGSVDGLYSDEDNANDLALQHRVACVEIEWTEN